MLGNPKKLEMPELGDDTHRVEPVHERDASYRAVKLEGWNQLNPLISDVALRDLEFALLGSSIALLQCFLTVL